MAHYIVRITGLSCYLRETKIQSINSDGMKNSVDAISDESSQHKLPY